MTDPSPEFSRFLTPRDLAALDGRSVHETATATEMAAVAETFGLLGVVELRVEARIARAGRDGWRLEGRLAASLTQACVVTLDPVAAEIDEPFHRRFEPGAKESDTEILVDPEAEDPPEPLGAGVDLGAVALETLALALDPYPRAEGVAFEPARAAPAGIDPLTDEEVKPFAALAALKGRLGGGDA